jgi:prepilin-type processing-associated H-X9-DG protein
MTRELSSGWAGSISTRHNNGGNYLWVDGHVDSHKSSDAYNNSDWWLP